MSGPDQSRPSRLQALDWLRGGAVLLMIECHVFNALLAESHRQSVWFGWMNLVNGFVAPAFLLVSGMVLGLNLDRRWGQGTGKFWGRVGEILGIGYLLHLPTIFPWQYFGPESGSLWAAWGKVDILQSLAGSLAMVLGLAGVCRNAVWHRRICLGLGLVVGLLEVNASGWPVPAALLDWVWPTGVGRFPLVPWAALPLLGVWLGPAILQEKSRLGQTARAVGAGAVLLVTAQQVPVTGVYGPYFVLDHLGWLMVVLAVCLWIPAQLPGLGWVLRLGQYSLWAYGVHLVLVYGSCLNFGLEVLQPQFGPWATLGFLAVVTAITVQAVNWRARPKRKEETAEGGGMIPPRPPVGSAPVRLGVRRQSRAARRDGDSALAGGTQTVLARKPNRR